MDFGLVLHTRGRSASALLEENRRCIERLPPAFTTLWIEDHFHVPESDVLECFTTLSVLAATFPQLRIGTLVLCQSYRHPALVAKMASTLHLLTGGRLILGLGAGWHEAEYRAYGYPFPPARERVAQLEEAICVIKALWTSRPASFEGRFYRLTEACCEPQPEPPIPLLIGGGGEKRMLGVVARHADWWNVNYCPPQEYACKLALIHAHCRSIGRDPAEIRLTYSTGTLLLAPSTKVVGTPPKRHALFGTPAEIVRTLEAYRTLGVSHVMVKVPDPQTLEIFGDEVLPAFCPAFQREQVS